MAHVCLWQLTAAIWSSAATLVHFAQPHVLADGTFVVNGTDRIEVGPISPGPTRRRRRRFQAS